MKVSPYIEETSAIILFEEAKKLGLRPVWETPYGFFSFASKGKKEYCYQTKFHTNSQLGTWMSKNKHALHVVLEANGFSMIPYCRPANKKELVSFFEKYNPIIKKPIAGKQSEGVQLIEKLSQLNYKDVEYFLFEKYITGIEYRFLVLKEHVIAVQKKELSPTDKKPWSKTRTNLPEEEWNRKLCLDSIAVAKTLKLNFIAVDYIIDASGTARILETNADPGIYSFHYPNKGKSVNVAKQLLRAFYSI